MITWHAHAEGYTGVTDDWGTYHVDNVYNQRGVRIGYLVRFTATGKANKGEGLWQGVGRDGEKLAIHSEQRFSRIGLAKRACHKHHKRVRDENANHGNGSDAGSNNRQREDC
jgi:hypothetical protein